MIFVLCYAWNVISNVSQLAGRVVIDCVAMACYACLVCGETTAPKGQVMFWPLSKKNSRAHALFCNYVNESYTFSGSNQLYVCTQPCFAKLQQASDKLASVVTIINELKAKSGRVGDTTMSGSTSLSSYVHSVSTPKSSLVTKRTTTSQQPRAKKLLRLEVNSVIINDLQRIYI